MEGMLEPSSALERLFRLAEADLPADVARYFLSLAFTPAEQTRYQELSRKAQDGALTPAEDSELDDLLTANDVLTILQSKARTSLQQRTPAA